MAPKGPRTLPSPTPDIERLIARSRDTFRALIDGIDDQVYAVDRDFVVTAINRAAASSMGLHPRQVVGRCCADQLCQPGEGEDCPARRAFASGRRVVAVREGQDPQGARNFTEVRAIPVAEGDGVGSVIVMRRDVTVQKEAEARVREHNELLEKLVAERTAEISRANARLKAQKDDLERANQELTELQELKTDLTNMVIHDLKGPLAEIVANIDMLSYGELVPLQEELLEAARFGSEEMSRMISNLLDISRMEENRLTLDLAAFDPAAIMEDIVRRYQPLARLKQITIQAAPEDGLGELRADQGLFERVLINLVTNAIDHTPTGGRIQILARRGPVFGVRDSGPGIEPELERHIFQKFRQGRARRGPKTGSGLGLAFCRMAVEAHGGAIWVESSPGAGSTFYFTLDKGRP